MIIRFIIMGTLLSTGSLAQDHLSGTWKLQKREPITGPQYANALPTQFSVHQQGDSLVIESVSTGAGGQDVNSRQAIAMDGKPATTLHATNKRKLIKTLQWNAHKKGLVITTVFHLPDNPNMVDFTRTESWYLTPDGKQLTIDKRSEETRSETWEVKGTYIKQ